jgi:hypothetical protein
MVHGSQENYGDLSVACAMESIKIPSELEVPCIHLSSTILQQFQ